MNKKLLIILTVLVIFIFIGNLTIMNINKNLENLSNIPISNINLNNINDGKYFGNYKVFPIDVELIIEIKNNKISNIDLLKHVNGQGTPAEAILGKVIEAQSLNVDIISGATYSSKVILLALADALGNN